MNFNIFLMKVDSDLVHELSGCWAESGFCRILRHFSHSVRMDVSAHSSAQPSVMESSSLSRARGGGDAGSQTPGCSATPVRCMRWRSWINIFVIHTVPTPTTTPTHTPLLLSPPSSRPTRTHNQPTNQPTNHPHLHAG